MTPRLWVLGNLTVDDVVMANGATAFGLCGGNALYAARGAYAWDDAVGVAARIGPDFPPQHRTDLRRLGLELSLVEVPALTIHNWALYESNDVRKFILWNGSGTHLEQSLRADELPSMAGAEACHIAPMPLSVQAELVHAIRDRVRVLALDPHEEHIAGNERELLDLLPALTIFLPSRCEAELLLGRDDPEAAALAFSEAGATVAAVKLGGEGSIVTTGAGRTVHVPAVEVRVTDPTGAGDAYCGGITAAYTQGCDALAAACHGTVSASLICETRGATSLASRDRALARQRLADLMERVGAAASA
ncbi:MAG: carbohydrate kinase family protein [Acidimicrobiia bacterium]